MAPVMYASKEGLADMVWGFIECSIETHTNLHTQRRGGPAEFLWLRDCSGKTALGHAILNNHVEVVKILMSQASYGDLASEWDYKREILLPVLQDYPEHDRFVFDKLEEDKTRAGSGRPRIWEGCLGNYNRGMETHIFTRLMYIPKLTNMDTLNMINPTTNTYLHIASKYGDVIYVKDALEKEDPSLISNHNSEGETPVYIAAREGHLDVLSIMLHHLKRDDKNIELHLIRSKDRHNALHIAIQNHHAPVVFALLEIVPQLANLENDLKESPLYLAAEGRYAEIVKLILKKCRDKTNFTGPYGKTALHAAAISNSAESIEYLLQEWPNLVNKKDENGWKPLCYAVHYNSSLAVESLLSVDNSVGYELVTQDNTHTSALHIAASRGHCETMQVLMNMCPGSREFDSKGRNILHVAIESKQNEVIEFIFQDKSLKSLINQKDNNGNTPVHLMAKSNFEMMQKVIDSRGNVHSLNRENRTPLDMIDSDEERKRLIKAIAMGPKMFSNIITYEIIRHDLLQKEFESKQKKPEARFKMVDNMVLVVTLIATATFAAAFTVPGGFNSDNGSKQGTPYLLRKAAFQAFVIANAIAFCCSCSVLLAHIVLLIYRNRYAEADEAEQKNVDKRIVIMYFLTGIALLAMLIAFVTGFYVVLLPSLWLAIFVCAFSICILVASLSYWLYF